MLNAIIPTTPIKTVTAVEIPNTSSPLLLPLVFLAADRLDEGSLRRTGLLVAARCGRALLRGTTTDSPHSGHFPRFPAF